jgi:hypothetical protein
MNHYTFRNRAESLMIAYMDYLPTCSTMEQRMKLLKEINILSEMIVEINMMPAGLVKCQRQEYHETIESKINEL